jgi:uncharacterized protein YodC (DUF2158 family)
MKLESKVRLKSGGPEMTVTSSMKNLSSGEESVICKWKDDNDELNMFTFCVDLLDVIT